MVGGGGGGGIITLTAEVLMEPILARTMKRHKQRQAYDKIHDRPGCLDRHGKAMPLHMHCAKPTTMNHRKQFLHSYIKFCSLTVRAFLVTTYV